MNRNESTTLALGERLSRVAVRFALVTLASAILPAGYRDLRSEDAAPGTDRFAPAPEIGGEAPFRYHIPDDLAAWTAMKVLIPESGEQRHWIGDAAGSSWWEERSSRLWVKGRRPGAKGRLVGYSRLVATREEARRGARQSAVWQVVALIVWRARDRITDDDLVGYREFAKLAEEKAWSAIEGMVQDELDQSIDRPYGRLHRAAVLVRADDKALARLASEVEAERTRSEQRARADRRLLFWRGGIAAAFVMLVAIAYCALNALTKGYFTGLLRVLAVLVLAAGGAAVVLIG